MKIKFAVALLVVWLMGHGSALAWNGAGHMVIAAETWKELPPATKAKVMELLKSHPDYAKWQSSFSGDASGVDAVAAFVFVRASTWPDEIRRHGNRYDHPHWHYIDYPLRPPRFPGKQRLHPTIIFFLESLVPRQSWVIRKLPMKSVRFICPGSFI